MMRKQTRDIIVYGPDTAFTLLFLKKANLGSEVTRMIKPDPDSAFFFADDPSQRFKTLKEAIAAGEGKANDCRAG